MFVILILIPAHPFNNCVTLGILPNLSEPVSHLQKKYIWGGGKVGLQLYVKHSLYLYYYLLIIALFSIQATVNLLLPHGIGTVKEDLMSFYT